MNKKDANKIVEFVKNPALKPSECCDVGSYDHQVSLTINNVECGIDLCIAELVEALNKDGIETVASCCGHGKMPSQISLKDGRCLVILSEKKAEEVRKQYASVGENVNIVVIASPYYAVKCKHCGWSGSSEECPTSEDWFTCPKCHKGEPEEVGV